MHPELRIVIRWIGIRAEANQAQGNCDGRDDVSLSLATLVCGPRQTQAQQFRQRWLSTDRGASSPPANR
jgi:hypothetical protein